LALKVVIPSAGLGTRLFPATKEQPKEMLPIFSRSSNGGVTVKPLLQLVFEQLYGVGFREFCFVVGRGKRSIEDHFTPDLNSVSMLKEKGKADQAFDLNDFYTELKTSTIVWMNQPEPKGFGHAVLMAQPFVQNEHCLVHAGDTYIVSKKNLHLKFLLDTSQRLGADAAFIVQNVEHTEGYGIIDGDETETGVYRVRLAVEKPDTPPTNLAIMPIYVFAPVIFDALKKTQLGKGGEIQLTDAIQKLVEWNLKVFAIRLNPSDIRFDIGNPESYWEALSSSYKYSCAIGRD